MYNNLYCKWIEIKIKIIFKFFFGVRALSVEGLSIFPQIVTKEGKKSHQKPNEQNSQMHTRECVTTCVCMCVPVCVCVCLLSPNNIEQSSKKVVHGGYPEKTMFSITK